MSYLEYWYVPQRPRFRGPRYLSAALLFSLVLLGAGAAAPAAAQGSPARLERLEVSLWPEYDRPAMLVMLRAWLPADAQFPATVTLAIPLAAGTPSAVAFRGADGSMLVARNTLTTVGDTIQVALTTPSPEIRLEYYVNLDVGNPQRAYRFDWPGGLIVDQLTFDVLHAQGAVDLEVRPAGTRRTLPDGRIEERGNLGALMATDGVSIEVRYTRPPGPPTTSGSTAPPATPPTQSSKPTSGFAQTEGTDSDSRWLILLVVATVTFSCGFALGRWRRRP